MKLPVSKLICFALLYLKKFCESIKNSDVTKLGLFVEVKPPGNYKIIIYTFNFLLLLFTS